MKVFASMGGTYAAIAAIELVVIFIHLKFVERKFLLDNRLFIVKFKGTTLIQNTMSFPKKKTGSSHNFKIAASSVRFRSLMVLSQV